MINADKPQLWKNDIAMSVDMFNAWFLQFAPVTYQATRIKTTEDVKRALHHVNDFRELAPEILKEYPWILPTLRMSTAPPIARDRLIGLAKTSSALVQKMEMGALPARMDTTLVDQDLERICAIICKLLDLDLFPWLEDGRVPNNLERARASTIIADRLCGAVADPIVRNAQEHRQLSLIEKYLLERDYVRSIHPTHKTITEMEPGTFSFRMNVPAAREKRVNIPIDVVIQPKEPKSHKIPLLIEAKSAGDFTNTNKRRKEEATKINQLRATYGPDIQLVLFLCGYFDSGYLGYEAAEGLDWVWEHRIEDILQLGI
ncbi:MAG: XamI family restriction endonuclease [Acidobacteria bacterium]|nr:XamI family restriction endonuclease [Acidobacteriota bacterium]MBI3657368.1 XamI family restriction endonuclease [Acidobacteriota bacterium]